MSRPAIHTAIKVAGTGKVEIVQTCPVPHTGDEDVLVRVVCVALNPVDWKSVDLSPTPGATWGCDFSGVAVTIGSAVKASLNVGDRVCGGTFGNNPDNPNNGAFAEYVTVPGDLVFKIPSAMSFEKAATLGIGLSTIGLSLYHVFKLPLPTAPVTEPRSVLVYGAGTATGTLAIQFLKMSGLHPIATCSPRSFERVKALGATKCFDYHSPACGTDIKAYTDNKLEYALDCITDTGSMKICYTSIGSSGGRYVALDPFPIRGHTRRSVKPSWIIAFTIQGRPINWQRPFKRDARPRDREFAEMWYKLCQGLMEKNAFETHPIEVKPGGLEGVIKGADLGRKGLLSGAKLVYRLPEQAKT
ncbi:putative alcohol dehydrogenase [Lentithecium fluviatile CBS 122367]|uniref:Putative alcohol dehydrogenase n=1 Tax=Lentithecium fluviatile CBS 122367 TaxID=1168545 RepID=A0A6G1J7M4_9PLEO|nr:putative alcohol dehydrogenase [Lentithecium fluviatile CBS 122367]